MIFSISPSSFLKVDYKINLIAKKFQFLTVFYSTGHKFFKNCTNKKMTIMIFIITVSPHLNTLKTSLALLFFFKRSSLYGVSGIFRLAIR